MVNETPARARMNKSTQINRANKVEILNLIWRRPEISRAEISRTTGLSAPAVSRIVDSLIGSEGLVKDLGTDSAPGGAGRRPNLLVFDGEDRYVLGVDMGYDILRGMIVDLGVNAISEFRIQTRPEEGFPEVMRRTNQALAEMIESSGIPPGRFCGLGIAVTGLAERIVHVPGRGESGGSRRFSSQLSCPWNQRAEIVLEGVPDVPIVMDNVSRTTAYGDLWFGRGREFQEFISILIRRNSVCTGVVLNGKMLEGVAGGGGGMGHITVDKNSRIRCACGNYGCLEAVATGAGFEALGRERMRADRSSLLWEECGGNIEALTEDMIVRGFRKGDKAAAQVYQDAAEYIGIGVAAMINVFGPKAVFIGGREVGQGGDPFFERIRQIAIERAIEGLAKGVQILEMTELGGWTTVQGAVALILEKILALELAVPPRRPATAGQRPKTSDSPGIRFGKGVFRQPSSFSQGHGTVTPGPLLEREG